MKKKALILSLFTSLIFILLSCGNNLYSFGPIYVFDTTVNVIMYENNDDYILDKENAKNHYNEIKKKLNEINRITNDFESNENNTSIYDLNLKRTLEVSDELVKIIKSSIDLIEDTNGYYNPFMGRLNHMWKESINNKTIPSDENIKNELEIIKNTNITIDKNKVTINGDGNIDLGGMVKGYALEWIRNYLDSNKVTKYVIDCGSSSIYIGNINTKVSITEPYKNGYIRELETMNNGVATSSGKYQNIVIDGKRYHHLLNPFTGYPSDIWESVSIIGNIDNMLLDAYSTAIFSMNANDAYSFAKKKNIEIILYNNGLITEVVS